MQFCNLMQAELVKLEGRERWLTNAFRAAQ